jgi:hypothetical protein
MIPREEPTHPASLQCLGLMSARSRHHAQVRTIALEEHFWTPELAAPPGTGPLAMWGQRADDPLRDLGQGRLADMDAHGIVATTTM